MPGTLGMAGLGLIRFLWKRTPRENSINWFVRLSRSFGNHGLLGRMMSPGDRVALCTSLRALTGLGAMFQDNRLHFFSFAYAKFGLICGGFLCLAFFEASVDWWQCF
jgi:hypothetical protein